ncbi:MAG: hypothetical protein ACSLEX_02110 [Minisyncoccota bacterium]
MKKNSSSHIKNTSAILWIHRHHITLLLLSILCIGAFMRLNNFEYLTRFNADQVRDAKVIDQMFTGNFPLLGPKAGGTTFHLGPAFYYLEYGSALLFGHTPAGMALIVPLASIASIGLFFIFFRLFFSPFLTLGLSLLYALSFYNIRYSRFAWNPNLIPFFLFAFLILLQRTLVPDARHRLFHFGLLGVIMGIGMQLHTTLFLLMPILFVMSQGCLFFQHKNIAWRPIILTIGITILSHTPFFIFDIQNHGTNIASFFAGTEKKTEKNVSITQNILSDVHFFLIGNTYALTGIEPQKNWFKPYKLIASKDKGEILLFVFGITFFTLGTWLTIQRLQRKTLQHKQHFLWLTTATTGLLFVLFLPIAEELSVRFFIVVFFLPFLFLGLMAEYLFTHLRQHTRIAVTLITLFFLIVIAGNLRAYMQSYDLDDYTAKDSTYGGISLGEAKRITESIIKTRYNEPDKKLFIAPFEFKRSIEYLISKQEVIVADFSPKEEVSENSIVFVITENTVKEKRLAEYKFCYTVLQEERFGRFTLLTFSSQQKQCKIGIITDSPEKNMDREVSAF